MAEFKFKAPKDLMLLNNVTGYDLMCIPNRAGVEYGYVRVYEPNIDMVIEQLVEYGLEVVEDENEMPDSATSTINGKIRDYLYSTPR